MSRRARALRYTVVATVLTLGIAFRPALARAQASPEVTVLIRTTHGDIELVVDRERAPVTAENFLHYVDAGLYAGGSFFRAVRLDNQPSDQHKIEVIQGSIPPANRERARPPIRLEGTGETGLHHLDGVVSMARAGPHTARADFFICIGDQPELDAGGRRHADGLGFAAFGRVVRGMDVVRAIHQAETEGQRLVEPVIIRSVDRTGG